MSVSVLLPVLLSSEESFEVLFVDFSTMSVYNHSGELASKERSEAVVSDLLSQQEASVPKMPHEQIKEVMDTEKTLFDQNSKHVFRQGY